jgi:hypothetical protein
MKTKTILLSMLFLSIQYSFSQAKDSTATSVDSLKTTQIKVKASAVVALSAEEIKAAEKIKKEE